MKKQLVYMVNGEVVYKDYFDQQLEELQDNKYEIKVVDVPEDEKPCYETLLKKLNEALERIGKLEGKIATLEITKSIQEIKIDNPNTWPYHPIVTPLTNPSPYPWDTVVYCNFSSTNKQ